MRVVSRNKSRSGFAAATAAPGAGAVRHGDAGTGDLAAPVRVDPVIRVEGMSFEQASTAVLGELQQALVELLGTEMTKARKAAEVSRFFKVDNTLGWQVYRVATATNPLAAGPHVPSRVSLEKLLRSAEQRGTAAEVIERVRRAFAGFEGLVESDAGDRDELEAMLSAFLPEERHKQEMAAKEAAFRAMSQLKGVATELDLSVMMFHPSADGTMVDRASINCEFGLRRARPDARIVIGIGNVSKPEPVFALDGTSCEGPLGTFLPQFCTSPLPEFEVHQSEGMAYYFIGGHDVGMRSAVDLVTADRRTKAMPLRWDPAQQRMRGPSYAADTPVKRLTFDVFVHNEVYVGVAPELSVYDTVVRGWVRSFGDPAREHDRLKAAETIRALPAGIAGARLAHVPRYQEMLEYAYRTLGWNPDHFRGYRLDVHYPMYGAQYMMGFRLPGGPA